MDLTSKGGFNTPARVEIGYEINLFERIRQAWLGLVDLEDNIPNWSVKQLGTAYVTFGHALEITEGLSRVPYHFSIHASGKMTIGCLNSVPLSM